MWTKGNLPGKIYMPLHQPCSSSCWYCLWLFDHLNCWTIKFWHESVREVFPWNFSPHSWSINRNIYLVWLFLNFQLQALFFREHFTTEQRLLLSSFLLKQSGNWKKACPRKCWRVSFIRYFPLLRKIALPVFPC